MREIKFRVWDKENNRMILPEKLMLVRPMIDILGNLGIMDIEDGCEWKGIVPKNQYELMQYTGLKDSKRTKDYPEGQEIYEGDIIRFEWIDDSCWGKAGTYKGYIRFNEGEYELVYINRKDSEVNADPLKNLLDWSEDVEVIGNIYKIQELLEV